MFTDNHQAQVVEDRPITAGANSVPMDAGSPKDFNEAERARLGLEAKRRKDFANDLPSHEIVDGRDEFMEYGRYLLFVDMLGTAAQDMCLPEEDENHADAERWLRDVDAIAAFCVLLDGSPSMAPAISKAALERPAEIGALCDSVIRSVSHTHDGAPLERMRSFFSGLVLAGDVAPGGYDDATSDFDSPT